MMRSSCEVLKRPVLPGSPRDECPLVGLMARASIFVTCAEKAVIECPSTKLLITDKVKIQMSSLAIEQIKQIFSLPNVFLVYFKFVSFGFVEKKLFDYLAVYFACKKRSIDIHFVRCVKGWKIL